MRKRYLQIFMYICLVVFMSMTLTVQIAADTGPKPSVRITFENMDDTLCYGTLLSALESTGPSSAWDGVEGHGLYNRDGENSWLLDYEIWRAFVDYKDADGYYFLQEGWCVSETGQLNWTYYPPTPFKILLYWPESGTYAVSGVLERYAFDSYYTVDMAEFAEAGDTLTLPEAVRSYPYGKEIGTFFIRLFITIMLEMAAALLFGFRYKRELLTLLWVNTATQLFLNLILQITNPGMGGILFFLTYAFLEIIIVIVEAILYGKLLPQKTDDPPEVWLCVLYAIIANVLSFFAGLALAEVLPGMF